MKVVLGILVVGCLLGSCTFLDADMEVISQVFAEANESVLEGKLDEAEQKLKWLIQEVPSNPRPYNNLGNLHYRRGETDKAETLYQKALELNPGYLVARVNLAVLSLNCGKTTEAQRLLRQGGREYPENGEIHNALGVCELKKENVAAAIDHFRKAIDVQGDRPVLYNNLAYAYAESNAFLHEALKLAKEALKAEPNNPVFMDTLGWVYFKRGFFDESLRLLDQSLNLNPRSEKVRSHMAQVYRWTGQKDKAVEVIKDGIRFRVMSEP